MIENVIEIRDLSRQFGQQMALRSVSLDIRKGYTYGLVGANGAGKTTLIRHMLGLLKAQQGSVRAFGMDPVSQPVDVLQRIGYLSEEREMPGWMRVDELMRYTAAFHPGWENDYACKLLDTFQLDRRKKVKELSKGMRAQVGLIAAVAHRPDLLLLDEPSSGLDPVVRKDILNALLRTVAEDGRTAIFSSHLLDEVELMSDFVFLIDRGEIILEGPLDALKEQHQFVSARLPAHDNGPQFDGLLSAECRDCVWTILCQGTTEEVTGRIVARGGNVLLARNASLQEIFLARASRQPVAC